MSGDGKRVIIGAGDNDCAGNNAGHARIFEEVNGTWVQVGCDIDGKAAFERFGSSVAMSSDGTRVIIGAEVNRLGGDRSGDARVFVSLKSLIDISAKF